MADVDHDLDGVVLTAWPLHATVTVSFRGDARKPDFSRPNWLIFKGGEHIGAHRRLASISSATGAPSSAVLIGWLRVSLLASLSEGTWCEPVQNKPKNKKNKHKIKNTKLNTNHTPSF